MTVEVQYVRMFVDLSKHALDIAKAVRKFDWVKLVGITEIDYTITIDTNNKFDKNRTVRELGREIAKTPLGAYAKMRKHNSYSLFVEKKSKKRNSDHLI